MNTVKKIKSDEDVINFLYRFTDTINLMDILERKKLVLVHPSLWEDTYENYFFKKLTEDAIFFEKWLHLNYEAIFFNDKAPMYLKGLKPEIALNIFQEIINIFKYFFCIEHIHEEIEKYHNEYLAPPLELIFIEKILNIRKNFFDNNELNNDDYALICLDEIELILSLTKDEFEKLYSILKGKNNISLEIELFLNNIKNQKVKKILNNYKNNTIIISSAIENLLKNSNIKFLIKFSNSKKEQKQVPMWLINLLGDDEIKLLIKDYSYEFFENVCLNIIPLHINNILYSSIFKLISSGYNSTYLDKLKNLISNECIKENYKNVIHDSWGFCNLLISKFSETMCIKNSIYGQSWTKESETDALWRIYTTNSNNSSIKIKSKINNIRYNENYLIYIKEINYDDNNFLKTNFMNAKEIKNLVLTLIDGLSNKRKAFKHESEYRLYAIDKKETSGFSKIHLKNRALLENWNITFDYLKKIDKDIYKETKKILEINIEPTEFIESITVNPLAPPHIAQTIRAYIDNFNNREENRDKRNIEFEVSKLYKFE